MPARRKIDRVTARLLFEAGATFAQIAERQGVSPQAAHRLAQREGWKRGDGDGGLLGTTATAKRILQPATPADHRIASEGVRSLERMRHILDLVAEGATRSIAAGMAGIGEETLREWAKSDAAFNALLREAEGRKTWRRVQALEKASERGDVAATKLLLERDPSSRDEWGARDPGPGEGGGIALVFNFASPAGAILGTPGPILEHAPERGARPPVRMVTAPLPSGAPAPRPISTVTEDDTTP